jgi:hypothetical protein
MTADERWETVDLLQRTSEEFETAVAAIDEAHWTTVPRSGGWSPAQVIEHLTVVEVSTGKLIAKRLFTEPAPPELIAETTGKDEVLRERLTDRGRKISAPDFVMPVGRWTTREEMATAFRTARELTVMNLSDPSRDLRRFIAPHPVAGPLDARQWGVFLSLHLRRHLDQLEEVLRELRSA